MNARKENLLISIIEKYIKSHEPVGSRHIAQTPRFHLSSATIRHEMSELEKEGYIAQPHTSAGRIPTEKGYEYYIRNFLHPKVPSKKEREELKKAAHEDKETLPRELAKTLAELILKAVFVSQGKENLYITGMSYLFSNPEFEDYDFVCGMTEVFDEMEEVVSALYDEVRDIEIFVGRNNPFGDRCSAVVAVFEPRHSPKALLGAIGPMRMDYDRTLSVMRYAKQLIQSV